MIAGTAYYMSDENVKENIQDVQDGMGQLMQLQPKTYTFRTDEFPQLGLSGGTHSGLLAQEVEAVLPGLVRSFHKPETLDSLGNVNLPAADVKAIDYIGLVPILISAVKEQNSMITGLQQQVADVQSPVDQVAALQDQLSALQEQMAALQAQLNGCCPAGGVNMQPGGATRSDAENATGDARKLVIQPNPFDTHTSLIYTLERSGRAQLLVNSADGKDLRVLAEAQREAGQYQYEWNTSDLAPGLYYVTLLLDGEPIVKKAVKVRM